MGDNVSVNDVSLHFGGPGGDTLTYSAKSSDTDLATASVSGSTVTVTGVAEGSVTVTITATVSDCRYQISSAPRRKNQVNQECRVRRLIKQLTCRSQLKKTAKMTAKVVGKDPFSEF